MFLKKVLNKSFADVETIETKTFLLTADNINIQNRSVNMGSININYEGKTESHEMEALPEQQGGEGGGVEVIEVTKEEYDSLPDSKYTDGKLYKIKDVNINGDATTVTYVDPDGNKTNVAAELDKIGNVYSLEEKIVGKWINNKPIYRRVLDLGDLTNYGMVYDSTFKEASVNLTGIVDNVDEMLKLNLIVSHLEATIIDGTIIDSIIVEKTEMNRTLIQRWYDNKNNIFYIKLGSQYTIPGNAGIANFKAVLEYTKL